MILNENIALSAADEQAQKNHQKATEDALRQHQEFLLLYRQTLVRLQSEEPEFSLIMPGMKNVIELEEREKEIVEEMGRVVYSKRYSDLTHQYRHVILPKGIAKWIPPGRLMKEIEWRSLGVIQTPGWTHYMIHDPEPHILLFKRPLDV